MKKTLTLMLALSLFGTFGIADAASPWDEFKVPELQSCPSFSKNLSYGQRDTATNKDIALMQAKIGVQATGYFGPLTVKAVKQFQKNYNIPMTGLVGPLTRAKLSGMCPSVATTDQAMMYQCAQDFKEKNKNVMKVKDGRYVEFYSEAPVMGFVIRFKETITFDEAISVLSSVRLAPDNVWDGKKEAFNSSPYGKFLTTLIPFEGETYTTVCNLLRSNKVKTVEPNRTASISV